MQNNIYSISDLYSDPYHPENLSSPSNTNVGMGFLSTPQINRSFNNSKSPLCKLKLKKSKRRECTPAYSPKNDYKDRNQFFTEKKVPEYQRLNFDNEDENSKLYFRNSEERFLYKSTNESENNCNNLPKKRFLSLIEDSLNEVSNSYYGVLGNQTTPDTMFTNIFRDEEVKEKDKYFFNVENKTSINSLIYGIISNILNEIKKKNFSFLLTMNTQLLYYDNSLNIFEFSINDLYTNLVDIIYDISMASVSTDAETGRNIVYIPGESNLNSLDKLANSRFIFEVFPAGNTNEVRLAVIEIQLF